MGSCSGPPLQGGPTNAARVGGGWVLCSQCLTFLFKSAEGENLEGSEVSPSWPLSVCLSVVGLFPGRCGGIISSGLSPSGLLLYLGRPVCFLFGSGP